MNFDYLLLLNLLLGLGWMVTLVLYFKDKKRCNLLKANSDWATDKAREKAEGIIQEAKNEALKELSDIKLETEKYQKLLEEGVKSLTNQEIDQYKKAIENITENVEGDVKNRSEQFKTEFDIAWKQLQQELQDKVKQDYEAERKKVEDYGNLKMLETERKIEGIVDEAVLTVLGKHVDSQVNKKLIIEALEEAKKKYAI